MHLNEALQKLREFVPPDTPALGRSTHFVDMNALSRETRPKVRRGQLLSAEAYSPVFESRLEHGVPWVNLSLLGLLDGEWIVGVEYPRELATHPSPRTSLNYSGPSQSVIGAGFQIDPVLWVSD